MWSRLSCVMNQLINTGIALNLLTYFRPFCEVLRVARALSNEKIFFILSSCKQDQYYNNSQLRLLIEQYVSLFPNDLIPVAINVLYTYKRREIIKKFKRQTHIIAVSNMATEISLQVYVRILL